MNSLQTGAKALFWFTSGGFFLNNRISILLNVNPLTLENNP